MPSLKHFKQAMAPLRSLPYISAPTYFKKIHFEQFKQDSINQYYTI